MTAGKFLGRREKRELQKFRVLISNGHGPPCVEYAWTENVSPKGARIQTDRPWETGRVLRLDSSAGQFLTRARVVYCQPLSSNTFAIGLEFHVRVDRWVTGVSELRGPV
jgi:hypothetical protein